MFAQLVHLGMLMDVEVFGHGNDVDYGDPRPIKISPLRGGLASFQQYQRGLYGAQPRDVLEAVLMFWGLLKMYRKRPKVAYLMPMLTTCFPLGGLPTPSQKLQTRLRVKAVKWSPSSYSIDGRMTGG